MRTTAIENAVDACYESVLAPENWPLALQGLARAVDSAGSIVYLPEPDPLLPAMPVSPDLGELFDEFVHKGWWRHDYRADRALPLLRQGRPYVVEHDIASDDERRHLAPFQDLYLRHRLPWWASISVKLDGRLVVLPFLRNEKQGPFTQEDGGHLASIAPHFRRVLTLSRQLSMTGAKTMLDLLDRMTTAGAVLDWRGAVAEINVQARALIGAGLTLSAGRLTAQHRGSDAALQQLLALALAAPTGGAMEAASPVVVRRADRRPLIIDAIPISGLDRFHHLRAVLIIHDPESRGATTESRVSKAFGLSRAESRLAVALVGGASIRDTAATLGLSVETVRAQLKSVLAKTETHRQTDLIACLSRIGSGLPRLD